MKRKHTGFTGGIIVFNWTIAAVNIQIPALAYSRDLRQHGVGSQTQYVLTCVNLLGIVPIDHVCGVPVGVLLGEAADGRIIISGAQIIISGFGVQVFAAVAEAVGVQGVGVFFVAEGVVVIFLVNGTVEVGGSDYVAVGVEEVVFGLTTACPADEVDAAQIIVGDGVVLDFGHHVAAVQEIGCPEVIHPLGCPDSLGVVGIGHTGSIHGQGDQLIEAVVGIDSTAGFVLTVGRGGLAQGVAVGVIGVGGGDGIAVFRFALRQQPVVGVVGKDKGTALEPFWGWDKRTIPEFSLYHRRSDKSVSIIRKKSLHPHAV